MAQLPNKTKVQNFTEHHKLIEFLDLVEMDVRSICVVTDDLFEVYNKKAVEDELPSVYVNIRFGLFHHLLSQFTALRSLRIAAGPLPLFRYQFSGVYKSYRATQSSELNWMETIH